MNRRQKLAATTSRNPDEPPPCCGFSVAQCTLLIAAIESIFLVLCLILSIVMYSRFHLNLPYVSDWAGDLVTTAILVPFGLLVIAAMVYGVRRERHNFLIPHLVWQILSLLCLVAAAVIYGLGAMSAFSMMMSDDRRDRGGSKSESNRRAFIYFTVALCLCVGTMFVNGIFFVKILQCFRYLREIYRRKEMVRDLSFKIKKDGQPPVGGSTPVVP